MKSKNQFQMLFSDLADYSTHLPNYTSGYMYHYTSPNIIEKILGLNEISLRFTKSDCVNDTSEGYYAYEQFFDSVKFWFETNEIDRTYTEFLTNIKTISRDYFNRKIGNTSLLNVFEKMCLNNHYYLCCFSRDPDSLPLWNYYVIERKYEGYNIGFDPTIIYKAQCKDDFDDILVSPVIYSGFFEMCSSVINRYKNFFNVADEEGKALLSYLILCFLEKYRLFVKHKCFEHEKEVRAVLKIKSRDKLNEEYDWSKGFPRQYVDVKFEKSAFKCVHIGPLMEKEISKHKTEYFLESKGYPQTKLRIQKFPLDSDCIDRKYRLLYAPYRTNSGKLSKIL